MLAAVIQFPVRMEVEENLANLAAALARLKPNTLAVAPEGSLSGYLPVPGFVTTLDDAVTHKAIERARNLTERFQIHLVVGACIYENNYWRNSSFYMGPNREIFRYDKINLAQSERATFKPGDDLPIYDITVGGELIRLGIQMCREIRYPEQWRVLATQGAHVIAYVNNAVGSTHGHELWRSHVISRAAENQRFVIGANNAANDQTCTSLIVSPSGKILSELQVGVTAVAEAKLNLGEVSDWVLSQSRDDIVTVRMRDIRAQTKNS